MDLETLYILDNTDFNNMGIKYNQAIPIWEIIEIKIKNLNRNKKNLTSSY